MSSCELKESLEVVLNFAKDEKHTVLIVDDEENNLQLLKRTFRGKYLYQRDLSKEFLQFED